MYKGTEAVILIAGGVVAGLLIADISGMSIGWEAVAAFATAGASIATVATIRAMHATNTRVIAAMQRSDEQQGDRHSQLMRLNLRHDRAKILQAEARLGLFSTYVECCDKFSKGAADNLPLRLRNVMNARANRGPGIFSDCAGLFAGDADVAFRDLHFLDAQFAREIEQYQKGADYAGDIGELFALANATAKAGEKFATALKSFADEYR